MGEQNTPGEAQRIILQLSLKVKLFLRLIKQHVTEVYKDVEV